MTFSVKLNDSLQIKRSGYLEVSPSRLNVTLLIGQEHGAPGFGVGLAWCRPCRWLLTLFHFRQVRPAHLTRNLMHSAGTMVHLLSLYKPSNVIGAATNFNL